MRVSVYREDDGELSVLVQGSVGMGKVPVLLKGITAENIVERTSAVVVEMRRPKPARHA